MLSRPLKKEEKKDYCPSGAYPDPNRQKRKVILKKGGRQMDLWAKYEDYLEWFEREKDRGKIDPDEEPESYDDFVDKCFEWNR